MTRILLTRPPAESTRLAKAIESRGHKAIIAPLLKIVPLRSSPSARSYDAIFATSPRAFDLFQSKKSERPDWMHGGHFYVVGERTAEAGMQLGLPEPIIVARDVTSLLGQLERAQLKDRTCLYLAGRERKPGLEAGLRAAGCVLEICETYDAIAVRQLPETVTMGLSDGSIGAVMHFSRRSAAIFASLVLEEKVEAQAANIRHFCLSSDVANALEPIRPQKTTVSNAPDIEGMLSMLDDV